MYGRSTYSTRFDTSSQDRKTSAGQTIHNRADESARNTCNTQSISNTNNPHFLDKGSWEVLRSLVKGQKGQVVHLTCMRDAALLLVHSDLEAATEEAGEEE
jgi:hypothetical protein